MLIYPQQNVIDYLLQIGAPPPASGRGESIVSITLTYPQQDVIYNLLQIGAPPERRGGGVWFTSGFVDHTSWTGLWVTYIFQHFPLWGS